jgi:hypothetical protein
MGVRHSKRAEIHYADVADALAGSGTARDPVDRLGTDAEADCTAERRCSSRGPAANEAARRSLHRHTSDPGPSAGSALLKTTSCSSLALDAHAGF